MRSGKFCRLIMSPEKWAFTGVLPKRRIRPSCVDAADSVLLDVARIGRSSEDSRAGDQDVPNIAVLLDHTALNA